MLDELAHLAAYVALALLMFLVLANVVIVVARLSRHRPLAERVVAFLQPFALLFRLGDPGRG